MKKENSHSSETMAWAIHIPYALAELCIKELKEHAALDQRFQRQDRLGSVAVAVKEETQPWQLLKGKLPNDIEFDMTVERISLPLRRSKVQQKPKRSTQVGSERERRMGGIPEQVVVDLSSGEADVRTRLLAGQWSHIHMLVSDECDIETLRDVLQDNQCLDRCTLYSTLEDLIQACRRSAHHITLGTATASVGTGQWDAQWQSQWSSALACAPPSGAVVHFSTRIQDEVKHDTKTKKSSHEDMELIRDALQQELRENLTHWRPTVMKVNARHDLTATTSSKLHEPSDPEMRTQSLVGSETTTGGPGDVTRLIDVEVLVLPEPQYNPPTPLCFRFPHDISSGTISSSVAMALSASSVINDCSSNSHRNMEQNGTGKEGHIPSGKDCSHLTSPGELSGEDLNGHGSIAVERVVCPSREVFESQVLPLGRPVILTGCHLGECVARWKDPSYLLGLAEGSEVSCDVPVHVSAETTIDLAGHRQPNTPGNFKFVTMPFDIFLRRLFNLPAPDGGVLEPVLAEGEHYYLRSVHPPRVKEPSDFATLFPCLAGDVQLPEWTSAEAKHSSVLRMSSAGSSLWMHYDTMDNFLTQVVGDKEVVLYPPSAAPFLYVSGSSSRVPHVGRLDVASTSHDQFPLFPLAPGRMHCTLKPGETLYLPGLWFHHVTAGAESASVAINTFFRALPRQEYDSKDLYGNKDLPVAVQACADAQKIGKSLSHLPQPFRAFYAQRAIDELQKAIG